ncbi:DUF3592 domain-containing protein [Streptomyces sp. UNOB3_S3]|uniref:DUF3592 domain-containing protein n=1 Tax=Streptomyces sp. UNOB3_S3 TaxID=2871682 RepID=UPI001E4D2BE8|nr:DUF3592 domain-containing protein [Streptomyces sp. UNOB3_S3]MCC3773838.1 DUF3592 domain-containing protein [Streptomyces sp. UNOB3_S3]
MAATGALCLVIGLIFAGVSVSFLTDAKRARGTVVALDWREDHGGGSRKVRSDDEPVAYPVIEFTPADGTPRKFRDSAGSNPPSYEVGEQVEVLYRPGSPEDARIKGFLSLWLMPLIFGGIGLVFTGIATVMALVTRRRR